MSTLRKLSPTEVAQFRNEWLQAVDVVVQEVRSWAERKGWTVTEERREVREERLGTYHVSVLQIDTPRGRVILEPIARDVLGAEGRVDLYAWPTLYRVMLLRRADMSWVVRTESGINWPQPWEEATFVTLAEGLLGEP
jgi:hypothetical protein